MSRSAFLVASIVGLAFAGIAPCAEATENTVPGVKSTVVYSGADLSNNAKVGFGGALIALDGNLATNGFTLYGQMLGGHYYYSTLGGAGNDIDVDFYQAHLMLGYTGIYNQMWHGVYVGVDHQNHDLSAIDTTNSVNGSETGVKFAGELQTLGHQDYFLSGYGEYSTAFGRYFSRVQFGPVVRGFALGAESVVLGDEEWNGQRIGSFVRTPSALGSGTISVSGGYQFSNRDTAEGGYGTLHLKYLF